MVIVNNYIKRALIRANCYLETLERMNLVTYQDRIKWRSPQYSRQIRFEQEGQDRIGELIAGNKPLMVARIGAVELRCLRFFLENRHTKKRPYSRKIKLSMINNAGFFPIDDTALDSFSEIFLKHLKQVDILAVWFNQYEDVICNRYCQDAELVELGCLEPYRFSNPWSGELAGKKVLVVHPFVDSIRKQYTEKRQFLFVSPDVLPEFELKTVRAVQSIAGSQVDFPTWFDAYQVMCDEIAKADFDVCLIGAGAYGLPLASFAKSLGKQSIHLGGVTQILFGIKGSRWERGQGDPTAQLFNEHWTRPTASETPVNKDVVEKGCYW